MELSKLGQSTSTLLETLCIEIILLCSFLLNQVRVEIKLRVLSKIWVLLIFLKVIGSCGEIMGGTFY